MQMVSSCLQLLFSVLGSPPNYVIISFKWTCFFAGWDYNKQMSQLSQGRHHWGLTVHQVWDLTWLTIQRGVHHLSWKQRMMAMRRVVGRHTGTRLGWLVDWRWGWVCLGHGYQLIELILPILLVHILKCNNLLIKAMAWALRNPKPPQAETALIGKIEVHYNRSTWTKCPVREPEWDNGQCYALK
jgi:hypothetical protein